MTQRMIQLRGLAADRPTLLVGQFGFDTDSGDSKLWIGSAAGNLQIWPPVVSGSPGIDGTPTAFDLAYWPNATEVGGASGIAYDSGNSRLLLDNTYGIAWDGRSIVTSPDAGTLQLTNTAANDSGGVIFGPQTVAFPRLKRSTTGLQVRLANDSALSWLEASEHRAAEAMRIAETGVVPGSEVGFGRLFAKSGDKAVYWIDSAGDQFNLTEGGIGDVGATAGQVSYFTASDAIAGATALFWDEAGGLLQFGGTSATDLALKKSGTELGVRFANDSAYAGMLALDFRLAGVGGRFVAGANSKLGSLTDGTLLLTNNAATSGVTLDFSTADTLRVLDQAATGPGNVGLDTEGRLILNADGGSNLYISTNASGTTIEFGGFPIFFAASSAVFNQGYAVDFRNNTPLRLGSDVDYWLEYVSANTALELWTTNGDGIGTDTKLLSVVDGTDDITLSDGLLQFGANDNTRPALRSSGNQLLARLADNSLACTFGCGTLLADGNARILNTGFFYWNGRSRLYSDNDGDIRLTDSSGTSFGLLQFGGTSGSEPALKKSGAGLQARLASDLGFASFEANLITGYGGVQVGTSSESFRWFGRSRFYSDNDGDVNLRSSNATDTAGLRCGRVVEASTAVAASPNALDVLESRKLLTNEGATARNDHDLPSAVAGVAYTFVVQDSDGMRINAAAGDTIRIAGSVSAAAGYIESTTIGDAVTVVAINATEWVATNLVGTGWSAT